MSSKKEPETRRERFIRIAEKRTNKILDMLKLLGNCASPSNYEYTEDDIKKIFNAIDREVKNARAKFDDRGIKKEKKFSLNK